MTGAASDPDVLAVPPAAAVADAWLPAALAVLVCVFLLGGTLVGFMDVILAAGPDDARFLFPATCH